MGSRTFEEIINELKNIIDKLEKNDLPINDAINYFENGIKLTRIAEQELKLIKDKVTKIVKDGKTSDFTAENNEENKQN